MNKHLKEAIQSMEAALIAAYALDSELRTVQALANCTIHCTVCHKETDSCRCSCQYFGREGV